MEVASCADGSAARISTVRLIMDRRTFLRAAGALLPLVSSAGEAEPRSRSRVVVARRAGIATDGGEVDADGVRELLGRAVASWCDTPDPAEAWSSVYGGSRAVGIKVNCLGGWGMSTRPELASAARYWLSQTAGPRTRVIVWDRMSRELEAAGFAVSVGKSQELVFGTDRAEAGYEREVRDHRSIGSCFSRILTTLCDAQLSMPVAKDHGLCGVTGALKNWFGGIHNPNKWHTNRCDPYIADLNDMPLVRDSQRLIVLDALLAQCHAGPAYNPRYRWANGGLVVSADPVAVDAFLVRMIEERRERLGLPSLQEDDRFPSYVRTAAERGLGTDRLEEVDIVEVE